MKSTIVGANGNEANVTADGKLETNTTVTVDTLTVTEVSIKDGASANKATVNADGSINVKHTGSIVVEETVVNAVSVPAGSFKEFNLSPTTEDEIWVCISIDKQPWTLLGSTFFYAGSDGGGDMFYPKRTDAATTHTTITPSISLYLGSIPVATTWGLTSPTSMNDAKGYKITPYKSTAKARVSNKHATDAATLTVKLIRVWRKAG